MSRPKILIIAMPNDVHVASWIQLVTNEKWDIHLFSSQFTNSIHHKIKNITVYHPFCRDEQQPQCDPSIDLHGFWLHSSWVSYLDYPLLRSPIAMYQRHILKRCHPHPQSYYLAEVIQTINPDIVHVIDFQQAGYVLLDALKLMSTKLKKLMVTNYRDNVHLYSKLKDHRQKIKNLLQIANYYACECERDIMLAQELGFDGEILPVIPNIGGFDFNHFKKYHEYEQTSKRKLILLKCYQSPAGRALYGLLAIKKCHELIRDENYRVGIYSSTLNLEMNAEIIAQDTGLNIEIYKQISHDDLLRLFGEARIHIGLSISDGIGTSLLEAMVMRVFPIQTAKSCANEWLIDDNTGIIINESEDVDEIAAALQKALTDDVLVNQAVEKNYQTAKDRLAVSKIQMIAVGMYQEILG